LRVASKCADVFVARAVEFAGEFQMMQEQYHGGSFSKSAASVERGRAWWNNLFRNSPGGLDCACLPPIMQPASKQPFPCWQCLTAVIILLAVALRLAGARGDLWLDELWTVVSLQQLHSPLDVFTKLHHDNNHYLNTLFGYAMGARGNWPGYRLLSLLAGAGAVLLASWRGVRKSPAHAVFAAATTVYSAEARGYALAVCFAYASVVLLERWKERPAWKWAALFAACLCLGVLSHLTFLSLVGALLVRWWWAGGIKQGRLPQGALMFLPVTVLFAGLYWLDIRLMVGGDGTPAGAGEIFLSSLGWSVGDGGKLAIIAGLAFAAYAARHWAGELKIFYLLAVVVFPLGLTWAHGSDAIYLRHFIVGTALLVWLAGETMASLWNAGGGRRTLSVALLAVYLAVNGGHIEELLRHGHGGYSAVVKFVESNTDGSDVSVSSDHDFRVAVTLGYFLSVMPVQKRWEYQPATDPSAAGAMWRIEHRESLRPVGNAPAEVRDAAGHRFELVQVYPTAPLVGLHWYLYRQVR
jgi:hypothetical protein